MAVVQKYGKVSKNMETLEKLPDIEDLFLYN